MNLRAKNIVLATALALLLVIARAPSASADGITTKTGLLTCNVARGFGWIVGSSRTVQCEYHSSSGTTERYSGTISRIGIDIGYLAPIAMAWAVVAPSTVPSFGALQGNYFGGTAEASVGVGGGVHVLFGGFQKSIALQPVSIEGDTGLYVGVGIAAMNLQMEDRQPEFENGQIPDTE